MKEWKKVGSKEQFLVAKREAKRDIHLAKRRVEERELLNVKEGKDSSFRIAKQMKRHENVVGANM